MSRSCIRTTHPRGANLIDAQPGERITSADGSRWAIPRNYKVSTGPGTYDGVRAWQLWEKRPGQRARVVSSGMNEQSAKEWIK